MNLSRNSIKKLTLFSIFLLFSLHFLKEEYPLYYVALFISYLFAFFILLSENISIKKLNIFHYTYLLLLFNLILICFYTIYLYHNIQSYNEWFTLKDILISIGRTMLMPTMALLIFRLYSNIEDLDNTLNFFMIVMIIATFTMTLQQIIGGQVIFGTWSDSSHRFPGMAPYASSAGNKVMYASSVGIAIIIAATNNKLNLLLKALIISLVTVGCFLSMQKAALINLVLSIGLILVIIDRKKSIKLILAIFLSIIIIGISFPKIAFNAGSLVTNTTGIEIIGNTKHDNIYSPIGKRLLGRLGLDGRWKIEANTTKELLFGRANFGGVGALGFVFDTNLDNPRVLGTTHNQYLDLYQQGGILLLIIFIIFLLILQINLVKRWIIEKDNYSKTFFFCNLIFMINCLVVNGIIYHPIASFIFWISVTYMLTPKEKLYGK